MANKDTNKKISNLFGSIAAAQTMVEQFPFSFGVTENGYTCSFDLLTALFRFVSPEPLEEKLIKVISDKLADPNCTWLQGIEETIKLALEANITNILTCELSPIIPDRLIGGGEFLKNSTRQINFSSEGVIIPLSAIDFTGLLSNCPADENSIAATSQYFPCYDDEGQKLSVKDLWKHDDFNAFLWYVKNKGVYGNLSERRKLMWDNRYKSKPYTKYERKPEKFFTREGNGIIPFNNNDLFNYNNENQPPKKQILECRYIDADGYHSDCFQFRLAGSNYYKTRALIGNISINKTIFEFNHDFLMSLRLFDPKTYLCQVVSSMFGEGNFTVNLSLTETEMVINEAINNIIKKVIMLDDTEIDDCFFTFSNEEYDEMIKTANENRIKYQDNEYVTKNIYNDILNIDFNGNSTLQENKTKIENVLSEVSKEVISGENTVGGWKLNYNYQFELIRMLAYPLIRPLFSPKVMTLIHINLAIMGKPFDKFNSFNNVLPILTNIIKPIIIQIKDMIVEILYTFVIEKLIPLLTIYNLRILLEQLDMYRQLIEGMITACSFDFNKNKKYGIDNVDYVDIDPSLEKLKQTNISNTIC